MESKLGSVCSSLEVPVVQELAKEKLDVIPSRYIRPNLDRHRNDLALSSSHGIPVIDMQKLFCQDSMDSELDKLHSACKEWGFFQLINHGVEAAVIEKMKLETKAFFDLPLQKKKKLSHEAGDIQGYGQHFVVSDDQKLDWADLFYISTSPINPNFISKLPPSFWEAIKAFSSETEALSMKILKLMAKALGMKAEEMEALFNGAAQSMRMNYYPPCPRPELVSGLCPHSDASALTVLLQIDDVDGLEINKDGVWIPVSPLPDAFIINIGDVLEIVTNGAYRSIEHRATVNRGRERLSIATFITSRMDGEVGPAASLVGPETPAKFKRIGAADFLREYLSKELNGKSHLEFVMT